MDFNEVNPTIVVQSGDSNEVETAKLMCQLRYLVAEQPEDWVAQAEQIIRDGAITADEVLRARDL